MAYRHGHHHSVTGAHAWRTAQNSAGYLLPRLRPGLSLLDVGAGPGTITCDLAAIVAPGRVTAVEPDDAVLELTRAEASRRGITVDTVVGRGEDLPFDADSFDVSHVHQVLHHVPDQVAVLTELTRVTRPGGLIAARETDFGALAWYPELPELDEWLEIFQAIITAGGGQFRAGRRLLGWAHAAGLTDVQPGASVWCFADPHDRAWWSGQWADRVISSAFADTARDLGVTDATLQQIATAWRTWGAHPDGWFIVPHGEILARVG